MMLYNVRPPYFIESGSELTGITADIVNRAFENANIELEWINAPAGRHLEKIKENKVDICAAGWFKNPEREAFAKYTVPIYQDLPTVLLTRKDNLTKISKPDLQSLLSDKQLMLLVKDGYSYGQFIDEQMAQFEPEKFI